MACLVARRNAAVGQSDVERPADGQTVPQHVEGAAAREHLRDRRHHAARAEARLLGTDLRPDDPGDRPILAAERVAPVAIVRAKEEHAERRPAARAPAEPVAPLARVDDRRGGRPTVSHPGCE